MKLGLILKVGQHYDIQIAKVSKPFRIFLCPVRDIYILPRSALLRKRVLFSGSKIYNKLSTNFKMLDKDIKYIVF
jgi:hypothetical protein